MLYGFRSSSKNFGENEVGEENYDVYIQDMKKLLEVRYISSSFTRKATAAKTSGIVFY